MKEQDIYVALVEDDLSVRETMQLLLEQTDGLRCVGAFDRVETALPSFKDESPDVVLMDIHLPGMSGIDGVRRVHGIDPGIKVIMLTVYQDDDNIFRSICAGAIGYLQKRTSKDLLVAAIRDVQAGGAAMNAGIARRVMELFRRTAEPVREESTLTQKEFGILQSLVDGCSYKMLADRHSISIETVRNHIKHIYEKLHVHSKSEAVAKALKERFV